MVTNRNLFLQDLADGGDSNDWVLINGTTLVGPALNYIKDIVLDNLDGDFTLEQRVRAITLGGITFPKPNLKPPVNQTWYTVDHHGILRRKTGDEVSPNFGFHFGFQPTPELAWAQYKGTILALGLPDPTKRKTRS